MASVFGHGVLAYTVSKLMDQKHSKVLLMLAILSSIIPDADVIAFYFGIPYDHAFGHRGFTHSISFAVLWSGLLTAIFSKGKQLIFFSVVFVATLSHGVLDAMTSGGKGVGFFIPFSFERYFFPFRTIKVSPIGVGKFFSEWGIQVLISEIKFILLPCVFVLVVIRLITYLNHPKHKNS